MFDDRLQILAPRHRPARRQPLNGSRGVCDCSTSSCLTKCKRPAQLCIGPNSSWRLRRRTFTPYATLPWVMMLLARSSKRWTWSIGSTSCCLDRTPRASNKIRCLDGHPQASRRCYRLVIAKLPRWMRRFEERDLYRTTPVTLRSTAVELSQPPSRPLLLQPNLPPRCSSLIPCKPPPRTG
jgi:hypothetical protein